MLGSKPWTRRCFDEELQHLPGRWHYLDSPADISLSFVEQFSPAYIFVLHWSWKIPNEIVEKFQCVCFHMTDVPYGRGGSPLQNLIARGHRRTRLTALRMNEFFDAGPVYMKQPLSLEGGAEEIYLRATRLSAKMIQHMIQRQIKPKPQRGKPVLFKRRKPAESELGRPASLDELFDFVRMLDAESYPHAFLEYAGFRFEFSRPALYDGRIVADVTITKTSAQGSSE